MNTPETGCPTCNGTGEYQLGDGRTNGAKCSTCHGTGRIPAQGSEQMPPNTYDHSHADHHKESPAEPEATRGDSPSSIPEPLLYGVAVENHAPSIPPTPRVTRFEVIDHRTGGQGRVFVAWPSQIELSYQDDGRTLKVFVRDK